MTEGGMGRRLLAALLLLSTAIPTAGLASVGGGQADAACTPDTCAPYGSYPTSVSVHVPVTASIATDCGFDPSSLPSGSLHAGELNGGFDQQVAFGLRCPTPVNVGVVSTNAGLLTTATPATGYTNLRDYHVELFLQGSSTYSADADCLASTLGSTGSCSFRGPATSTAGVGGLELTGYAQNGAGYVSGSYLRVHDTSYSGGSVLVADPSYADTLTVTLSAVM